MAVGPLLMGSYYGAYRWPLLILATLTGVLGLLVVPPQSKKVSFWVLVVAVLGLMLQGGWMWYNARTFLIENEIYEGVHYLWHLEPVAGQPYPGLPGAVDKAQAWDRLSYVLPCLLLVLSVRQLVAHQVIKLRTMCGCVFWVGVFVAGLGLAQRLSGAEGIYWMDVVDLRGRGYFFATYRSPGIAATYLNMALMLGVAHFFAEVRTRAKSYQRGAAYPICVLIGVLLVFVASIFAGSKAAAVMAVCGLLLWIAGSARMSLRILRYFPLLFPSGSSRERNIILGAIGGAFLLGGLALSETVVERWKGSHEGGYGTLVARQEANKVQVAMVEDEEWGAMGFGPGAFYVLFPIYVEVADADINERWDYAHNDYLQTYVEWGWLGGGMFAVLVAGGFWGGSKSGWLKTAGHKKTHVLYVRGGAIAMVCCMVQALIDFPLQIESIGVIFAILVGAGWGVNSLGRRGAVSEGRKTTQRLT
ncbi:O-antigen ligase family protein [Rubritalea tangerina]|uniref:O-antigen ligase family protein n=1 Tax=Rubritalea tangerina TaxID=430798 RepID=A0ABW4ZAN1_9BACT